MSNHYLIIPSKKKTRTQIATISSSKSYQNKTTKYVLNIRTQLWEIQLSKTQLLNTYQIPIISRNVCAFRLWRVLIVTNISIYYLFQSITLEVVFDYSDIWSKTGVREYSKFFFLQTYLHLRNNLVMYVVVP